MRSSFHLDVYLVTDRSLSRGRDLKEVVSKAVQGGVSMVQLREKEAGTREFVELASEIGTMLRKHNVPLIINDRLDVALAVGADGVHIGQQDMPFDIARHLLGPDAIIGLSVESVDDARRADPLDVDYLGISPIYLTPTKTDLTRELGTRGVRDIKSFSRHPLVGIGGLNAANAGNVIAAGADGVAVVSAICSADDPQQATSNLVRIVKQAKQERSAG